MRTLLLLALLLPVFSRAESEPNPIRGYKGNIEFTAAEMLEHLMGVNEVTRVAGACLQRHLDEQNYFWEQWKLSRHYGVRSDWALQWTQEQKEALFRRMHVPLEEMRKLKPVNCILMTMACLEEGFTRARQQALWARIKEFTELNGTAGLPLQLALQRLGWRVLYWNPDTAMSAQWDVEERERDKKIREGNEPEDQFRFWGYHEERLKGVRRSMRYLYNPVDDITSLIDYQQAPPRKFTKVPFFVGTAHGGFHVFPGKYGYVIEAHNTGRLTNKRTVEAGLFDTLHPREPHPNGGAYGRYRSGLIAVPPGSGY